MYDAKIYFPTVQGKWSATSNFQSYPLTVRLTGFEVPDVETSTYDVKYHGMAIKRPKTEITLERKIDLEFREDGAFDLRRRLTAWHMVTSDPVTGGLSNTVLYFGKIEVYSLTGDYFANQVVDPDPNNRNKDDTSIFASNGEIHEVQRQGRQFNPLAKWIFYNVWPSKVGGIKFNTETADPNKFSVTFNFMDVDWPQYGMNSLAGETEIVPIEPGYQGENLEQYRGRKEWPDENVGAANAASVAPYTAGAFN